MELTDPLNQLVGITGKTRALLCLPQLGLRTQPEQTANPSGNRVSGSAGERNRRPPLVRVKDGALRRARRSGAESLVRWQDLWRGHHGAAARERTDRERH